MNEAQTTHRRTKGRYFLAGLVALIPLWITLTVIRFLYLTLSNAGAPVVGGLAKLAAPRFPALGSMLQGAAFQSLLSFVLVVVTIYLLGWLTSIVVGRRLLAMVESLFESVPVVKPIYGSIKRLVAVLQEKPGGEMKRVVLIDFPSAEMKTVGLVTRIFNDDRSGREVAAVYVPTTPVPTSGYLEIVPVELITPTNWTIDEAMAFIVSGGAIAPGSMPFDRVGRLQREPQE